MPAPKKPAKTKPEIKPETKSEIKPEIKEAHMEKTVFITVPEMAGTEILEVSINERVWKLRRGETAEVPEEVAVVIKRSVKADKDLRRRLQSMRITPNNPFGKTIEV